MQNEKRLLLMDRLFSAKHLQHIMIEKHKKRNDFLDRYCHTHPPPSTAFLHVLPITHSSKPITKTPGRKFCPPGTYQKCFLQVGLSHLRSVVQVYTCLSHPRDVGSAECAFLSRTVASELGGTVLQVQAKSTYPCILCLSQPIALWHLDTGTKTR